MISRTDGPVGKGNDGRRLGQAFRFLALCFLLTLVVCETYYVVMLRERFSVRSEEVKNISMQLQSLRNESAALHEELSSIKSAAGEDADGNLSVR
jgi:hypothetical protein